MKLLFSVAAIAICAALPATAQEARRQLGPHQHGHGRLNIAIEGSRVSMELEVPGMDIAGFEHEPSTPEQKAAIEKAKAKLGDALSLFKPAPAAGCKLASANVSTEAEHESEDEHEHAQAADRAKGEGHAAEGEHRHSEFHAEYALDCASPSRLTSMTFDYFKEFTGARQLDIAIITPKGQSSYEVTRDKPSLDLSGVM